MITIFRIKRLQTKLIVCGVGAGHSAVHKSSLDAIYGGDFEGWELWRPAVCSNKSLPSAILRSVILTGGGLDRGARTGTLFQSISEDNSQELVLVLVRRLYFRFLEQMLLVFGSKKCFFFVVKLFGELIW